MLTVLQVGKPHRYLGEASATPTHKTLQESLSKGKTWRKSGNEEN